MEVTNYNAGIQIIILIVQLAKKYCPCVMVAKNYGEVFHGQIAPWTQQATIGNFPALRWAQTAGYGYVPNSVMNKVFMAVAMDLADYDSTWNT